MAGNFTVFVDGAPFTVTFAEGSAINPQSAPVAEAAPLPAASATAPITDGTPVLAVMPGNVYSISVKVGDEVKEGEEVAVLEAMKMENPVKAPCAGKIIAIKVAKGDTVGMGDVMMFIG